MNQDTIFSEFILKHFKAAVLPISDMPPVKPGGVLHTCNTNLSTNLTEKEYHIQVKLLQRVTVDDLRAAVGLFYPTVGWEVSKETIFDQDPSLILTNFWHNDVKHVFEGVGRLKTNTDIFAWGFGPLRLM